MPKTILRKKDKVGGHIPQIKNLPQSHSHP